MNLALLILVIVYLVGTLLIGAWAGSKVKNTSDFAVAGHSLPLYMVITTSFATWFGAETVMGIPAKFTSGGLKEVVEDPFGASMCLVLVGLFFAPKLYKMKLLTIGDYYRNRYGVLVEILTSVIIIVSYLGWVAAQVTALGLVFSILSGGIVSISTGMLIGTLLVLIYVIMGGMLAVAYTDFVQMIVLVLGLSYIAWVSADLAGGADRVFALANEKEWFSIFPESNLQAWLIFLGAAITMMFGSIPQQDVFQRVMSANNVNAARGGAIIGGLCYLAFAFVPMFIVVSSLIIIPNEASALLSSETDRQKVLPTLILTKMPFFAQVMFFGALVSAIKSTSSATLLAPSTSFVENILRHIKPNLNDKQILAAMRISIFIFTCLVLTYAILAQGTSIYDMVSSAYQVTLAGAFVPLAFGLFWKRATTQGALGSIILGIGVWLALTIIATWDTPEDMAFVQGFIGETFPKTLFSWGEYLPSPIGGLGASIVGMLAGSLLPQWIKSKSTSEEEQYRVHPTM